MRCTKAIRGWLMATTAAVVVALPLPSPAQTNNVDPDAIALLRRATDYFAGMHQFSLVADTTIEIVNDSGQKLQLDHLVSIDLQRPNRLRVERVGDLVNQTFYYDGKSLAVNLPEERYYASTPVPATLDAMLDFVRNQLDLIAPGSDLLYTDSYQRLAAGLTAGYIIGKSEAGGVQCDHLAFRNNQVDWQIWIQEGDQPVPRKLVVTSKRFAQAPEFAFTISRWNPAPSFSNATFQFVPPEGSRKIEFRPATLSGKAQQ